MKRQDGEKHRLVVERKFLGIQQHPKEITKRLFAIVTFCKRRSNGSSFFVCGMSGKR